MIDQGMGVAFAGDATLEETILWVTTWEPDDNANPVWPQCAHIVFEEIHHGVRREND
jgi:hypothetical protein